MPPLECVKSVKYETLIATTPVSQSKLGPPSRLWRRVAMPASLLARTFLLIASLVLATIEKLIHRFPNDSRKTSDMRLALQKEIEDHLGPKGVLVLPAFPRTAPKHGANAVRHFLGFTYCAVMNPLELPATAVPTGFGAEGLPLGVQVAGVRNNDHLTLFVAGQIEKAFGGWKPREEIQ